MYDLGSLKACIIQAVLSWDQRPIYTAWFSNSWPDVWSTCSRRRAVFAMAQQSAPRPIVSFNVQAQVARISIWEAGADTNANGQPPQGTSEMKQWELTLLNPCRKARHRCDHEWVPPIWYALCALDFMFSRLIVCAWFQVFQDWLCTLVFEFPKVDFNLSKTGCVRLMLISPRLMVRLFLIFWRSTVRSVLIFKTTSVRLISVFKIDCDWLCAEDHTCYQKEMCKPEWQVF